MLSCLSRLLIKFKASERVVHQVGKSSSSSSISSRRCMAKERHVSVEAVKINTFEHKIRPHRSHASITPAPIERAHTSSVSKWYFRGGAPHLYRECSRICVVCARWNLFKLLLVFIAAREPLTTTELVALRTNLYAICVCGSRSVVLKCVAPPRTTEKRTWDEEIAFCS